MASRWIQTAHGRVLLLGAGWLGLLLLLVVALQVGGGGDGDWKLLGYLALWTYASPVVGLVGLALAIVNKVDQSGNRGARTAGIVLHAAIVLVGLGLIWNASRG